MSFSLRLKKYIYRKVGESLKDKYQIKNSTAEFLIFTGQNKEDTIEVMVVDENVWMTQDLIAELFGKGRSTITEHIKKYFS